ncbi:cupin domain-containing protein [Bacillus sp. FJAT-29937]|uniref:cupin domain-containing protein n=1 Tax=Bacillus sp. FJAT-29937 TaxID=1720553 RepID=UPI00082F47D8|nr:cupin domain-containing protein [Bacillus sp. FJAT-29937]
MIRKTIEKSMLENCHGGVGKIEIHKKITQDDQVAGLSLFAQVIIKPHSTIGYHPHPDDAEAYYVLRGEGIFLNHKEERIPVKAGDLCLIKKGQSHGLENPTDNDLEIIAVVY